MDIDTDNLPKHIKVGAHVYSIAYHDVLYDSLSNKAYNGQCNDDHCEINIARDRAGSQIAETFLHEAMHAICLDRDIDLCDHDIDQIAVGVLAMMVDNPGIFGVQFVRLWDK